MSATVEMRASERRRYAIDFSKQPEMIEGEKIISVDSVVGKPPGLTIGTPAHDGQQVQVEIAGGAAGSTYHVIFTVTTDLGSRLVGDGKLKVLAD